MSVFGDNHKFKVTELVVEGGEVKGLITAQTVLEVELPARKEGEDEETMDETVDKVEICE